MGEPIRWSISVDKETDAIAEILQRTYAEYVGSNRSRLVQFLFKRFHRMAGNVAVTLEQQQGINQAILSEEITTLNNLSQIEFPALASELAGPKPPMRISAPQAGARRRNIHGVNRRSYLGAGVLWANESLSFPGITVNPWGKVRPFKSNTLNRLRAA